MAAVILLQQSSSHFCQSRQNSYLIRAFQFVYSKSSPLHIPEKPFVRLIRHLRIRFSVQAIFTVLLLTVEWMDSRSLGG